MDERLARKSSESGERPQASISASNSASPSTNGGSPAADAFRYYAFISYSHRDKAAAVWLHRAIETYRIPAKLVGAQTRVGKTPRRLAPVFRDNAELPASGDLSGELTEALRGSRHLIVICSPASASSRWVNEEILTFKRLHGEQRVLGLIVDGEPYSANDPGGEARECFPRAMRFSLGPAGELSNRPAEPIAADLRSSQDGRRTAKLKIIAGLAGVKLDHLVRRETQRRMRRLATLSTLSLAGMVLAIGLAVYADTRRIEANHQRRIAEGESAAARAAADYLVGTFELANPAPQNPRTITALSILARSADRAHKELAGQPVIQSRLLDTIGRAYNNLGLLEEARTALERSKPLLVAAGPDGAPALLTLARTYSSLGQFDQARATVALAQTSLGRDRTQHVETRAVAADLTGQILAAAEAPQAALVAHDEAVRFCDQSRQISAQHCANFRNNRGVLLSDLGRFDEAEQSLLEANAAYRRTYGALDRRTGESYLSLAQNAFNAGKLKLAEQRIGVATRTLRAVLDPDSLILAETLSTQGQIYQSEGKLDQAKAALQQAIVVYKQHFGKYHNMTGGAYIYLALVESDLGHTDTALDDIDEAKRNYKANYRNVVANDGDLLVNRAKILAKAGRTREAGADCASGLRILMQTLGPASEVTKASSKICTRLTSGPPKAI